MTYKYDNPFEITKASFYSDQQIKDYWVDVPGLHALTNPRSLQPMIILGGKGSGKTHLMRYFSYRTQRLSHANDVLAGIRADGYLGIYLDCQGLNSARFNKKALSQDESITIFSYYFDLTLAWLLLSIVIEAYGTSRELTDNETAICADCLGLFDDIDFEIPRTLTELRMAITTLQNDVSMKVNNLHLTKELNVKVLVSPGKLQFGLPKILANHLIYLKDINFLYLIDELENLSAEQQKYINTLVREISSPCSIRLGARLYGIKTYQTLNDGEENKDGSEFVKVQIDDFLRKSQARYKKFAKLLIGMRLQDVGIPVANKDETKLAIWLDGCFQTIDSTNYFNAEIQSFITRYDANGGERPYLKSLRQDLKGLTKNTSEEMRLSMHDIDMIIERLRQSKYPMLEKLNVFLLYQAWYSKEPLVQASADIKAKCARFLEVSEGDYKTSYGRRKWDLFAQLMRECEQEQKYNNGLDTYIDMSQGIPRNLLEILKRIHNWAVFLGEAPFCGSQISVQAQHKGLLEASEWFFTDARAAGTNGKNLRESIHRLAEVFREMRFSNKPPEKSVASFSCDLPRISETAQNTIDLCCQWSLLINIPDQKDKNSLGLDRKYKLNTMLAPKFQLHFSQGGTVSLDANEVNAIFSAGEEKEFDRLIKIRRDRMNAPFVQKTVRKSQMNISEPINTGLFSGERDD